jgi:hypothetical protein
MSNHEEIDDSDGISENDEGSSLSLYGETDDEHANIDITRNLPPEDVHGFARSFQGTHSDRLGHATGISRNSGPARGSTRQNEYFVPRDGIDREVISADICRYLGNDALVRPGHYEVCASK